MQHLDIDTTPAAGMPVLHRLPRWLTYPLVLGCILWLAPAIGLAQQEVANEKITEERVQVELRRLDELTGQDPELKTQLEATYNEALAWLKVADWWAKQEAQFTAQIEGAPTRLAELGAEVSNGPPVTKPTIPPETGISEAEREADLAQADAEAAQERIAQLEAEPARRTERRTSLNAEIVRVRAVLIETIDALRAPGNADASLTLRSAQSLLLLAKRQAFQQELWRYQRELQAYDATAGIIPDDLDQAKLALRQAEVRAETWRNYVRDQRRRESELETIRAQRSSEEAENLPPALERLAQENAELAQTRSGPDGLTARLDHVSTELASLQKTLIVLRTDFSTMRSKVDAAGLTPAMGLLLRRQYNDLPNRRTVLNRTRVRQSDVASAQYQVILLEEERKLAPDVETQVAELLAEISSDEAERARLETVAREHLQRRRNLRASLITENTTFIDTALELNAVGRRLAALIDEYRDYIEERIFWVRSVGQRPTLHPGVVTEAAQWLLSPTTWRTIAGNIATQRSASLPAVATLILAGALVAPGRRWCTKRLERLGHEAARVGTDSALLTVQALTLTLAHSATLPLLMLVGSWILIAPARQPGLAIDVAAALRYTALFWWTIEFPRQVLRQDGLAGAHFGWTKDVLPTARRNLFLLSAVLVPCALIVFTMEFQESEMHSDSLGRVAFLVALASLVIFNQRLTRSEGTLYRLLNAGTADSRWGRRWRLVSFSAVIAPAGLILLALLGYYYTAQQLTLRLHASFVLATTLAVINGLLLRWLFVTRRRLALEEARKQREARLAKLQAEGELDAEADHPPIEEEELDIPALDAQTRQLFRSAIIITLVLGLYAIWATILPALNRLDQVQVWPSFAIVDNTKSVQETPAAWTLQPSTPDTESEPAAEDAPPTLPGPTGTLLSEGAAAAESDALPNAVTLANLGLALVIGVLTFAGGRNLPSLLEIAFLQRLPLDRGARYAITTIARYAILLIGITFTFGAIGIGWSSIQWLAAALTFGLAFGLQEVFANFVSGLIILLERPMRVGDIVTVGNISGTVSRIRMRATTITDWDRKELIVPNKQFITDQLVNWSLSDSNLRLVITVGVAYGSDMEKAKRLLREITAENKLVLDDPPSRALFLEFGDSTLNIDLHVFISNIDERLTVKDQLHDAIKLAFEANDIEIAFPQRDLHIRSSDIPLPGAPPTMHDGAS